MDNRKGLSSLESSRSRLSSRLWSLNGSSQRSVFTTGRWDVRTDGEGGDAELVARVRIAAEAAPLTMRACQPAPAQQAFPKQQCCRLWMGRGGSLTVDGHAARGEAAVVVDGGGEHLRQQLARAAEVTYGYRQEPCLKPDRSLVIG